MARVVVVAVTVSVVARVAVKAVAKVAANAAKAVVSAVHAAANAPSAHWPKVRSAKNAQVVVAVVASAKSVLAWKCQAESLREVPVNPTAKVVVRAAVMAIAVAVVSAPRAKPAPKA